MSDFFKELQNLREKTPQIGFHGYQNVNSEYCDFVYFTKNSYLCFDGDYYEKCMYCYNSYKNKFCVDCAYIQNSELLYECVDCVNCYNSDYLQDCKQTSESFLGYDLVGCNQCFGCAGLRHKNNHIFNKPYLEEEYMKRAAELRKQPILKFYVEFEKLKRIVPHLYSRQFQTDNSFGDHLFNCQRSYCCYDCEGLQQCGYMHRVYNIYGERTVDSWDSGTSVDLQLCYQTYFVGKGYNCNFCFYCEFLRDSEYCDSCFHSEKLFGCAGLNRKSYYILNKPYSEGDWYKEVARIKQELRTAGLCGNWPAEWKMSEQDLRYDYD